ncbi:MAG TPA: peptidoglycan-binding protein, partial [Mesorhizobium sp.]
MNSKRSYLDTPNAGRQRQPLSTLDQLNQSLQALEQQIGRTRGAPAEPRYPGTQPYAQRPAEQPRAYPQARASMQAAPRYEQNYQAIARDIDRARGQEDSVAMIGKIAGELRGLREELRHQTATGLHHEFEALRADIDRACQTAPASRQTEELGREFERLSGAIQMLAEKSDDRSVNSLRLEMEQVRSALDALAREESVQSVDRRFDDFDRRWSAFETRHDADQRSRSDGPGIAMLAERLEQIGSAVNNLPESLSLRSLEEKVRTLAAALDHFTSRENSRSGDTLAMIDERLDEISRAIVASTVAAQASGLDAEAFERIENRISALAAQIEEVAGDRPDGEVIDRLNMLSSRVDQLATRANLPEQAMERLGQQIALIADKIDHAPSMPDPDYIFQGLEQRFEVLSSMMERRQGDALEQGNMLFRDLERRLDEVADRLDQRMPGAELDSAGIMDAIDARFTALAKRLETRAPDPAGAAAIRGLESRLEDISARLDHSAAQVASIDPQLIRSLEAQVTGLSAHLTQPGTPLPEFEDIVPRLNEIERSLAGTHDSIVSAAREAAESAVRSLAGSSANTAAVSGLAEDLKTLETLTRRSDERNSKTFEAIHDTLLKIVERLGSLEHSEPASAAKIAVQNAPSMDFGQSLAAETIGSAQNMEQAESAGAPGSMAAVRAGEPLQRSPAQAAAAAALAALGADAIADKPEKPGRRKSMFGGLARAFSKKEAEAPALPGSAPVVDAPAVDLDEPLDPRQANRPLEPGSGAPDLNAIMRRVRDERGQPARQGESEASNSDFIAAARRAAQAAAAEADALKRQSAITGPVRALRVGDMLKVRRKPILMATTAIALALAGTLLGKAFLSDAQRTADIGTTPIVAEQKMDADAISPAPAAPMPVSAPMSAQAAPADVQEAPSSDPVRVVTPSAPKMAEGVVMPSNMPQDAETPMDDIGASPATAPAAPVAAAVSPAPATPTPATPAATAPAATASDTTGTVAAQPMPEPAQAALDIPSDAGPAALRKAAAEGDAKALFEVASRYAEARGVKQDMAAAAKWYEKSAELGLAPAEYRIGNFY